MQGNLNKMRVNLSDDGLVQYQMMIGAEQLPINERIGSRLQIQALNRINCVHCQRKTSKSFGQGYCFPCFRSLAQCDMCIVKPETCHFAKGTCREPEWGQKHCMIEHTVYIANSSGPKIGITRRHQKLTRWIDQGAVQAIELCTTSNRKDAGLIEIELAKHIPDKTNWRKMLMEEPNVLDLVALRTELGAFIPAAVPHTLITDDGPHTIRFPIIARPTKLSSLTLEGEDAKIDSRLIGIKAQYLIFEAGVINIRKFQGYEVNLS